VWAVRETSGKSILTATSGFIKEAGFTHSLTPARNCTYGCTYCYVPTMGVYAGLSAEDVKRWGQFTTFKANAPELLESARLNDAVIYCSPLVDPYQPMEREYQLMPRILRVLLRRPPRAFAIQTRAPLLLRDLVLLKELSKATLLTISMSITTDRDSVRKRYEPHCESNQARLECIRALREEGIEVYATLAPLLPCHPERLANLALDASKRTLIGDPLHVRETKRYGATTRSTAVALAERWSEREWFDPAFQNEVVGRIRNAAAARGLGFEVGPRGFSLLTRAQTLPL
jgi:DNA repair photolyase